MLFSKVFGFSLQACMCALLAGCFLQSAPDEYIRLVEMPKEKRYCAFKELPIDKQLDFYLYSMRGEPPRPNFENAFATQGPRVIPPLLNRLRNEPAEHRQVDSILLLELITTQYVDLKDNREVISTVEEVIAKMQDPDWKRNGRKVSVGHQGWS